MDTFACFNSNENVLWVVLMNIDASRKFCLLGNYTVKEKVKAKPTLAISVLSND